MTTFALLLIILVGVAAYFSIKIVPQQEQFIVERFGKYQTTLEAGLNYIIPFIDSIAYKVTLKDQVINIQSQEAISKDNAVLIVNALAYIRVVNSHNAVYRISDYRYGVVSICQTSLRSIIGGMELDEALSNREQIKAKLKESIETQVKSWGCDIVTVEIQDIKPSHSMQDAMEAQAAAERNRRAMVTTAEGEKQALITRAQGNLEAARINAEATVVTAQAVDREAAQIKAEGVRLAAEQTAQAMEALKAQMGENALIDPASFILGQQYVEALRDLGASENSKTVVLPPNLLESIKGMVGNSKP